MNITELLKRKDAISAEAKKKLEDINRMIWERLQDYPLEEFINGRPYNFSKEGCNSCGYGISSRGYHRDMTMDCTFHDSWHLNDHERCLDVAVCPKFERAQKEDKLLRQKEKSKTMIKHCLESIMGEVDSD